jgi:hypothetical protein
VIRAVTLLLAAILLMTLTWLTTGVTFGLFIAGLFALAVMLPPLTLAGTRTGERLLGAVAIAGGIALVWLVACLEGRISFGQWIQSSSTLIAFAALLVGMVMLAARLRLHAVASSAVTAGFATLWLTWPIWLSPTLRKHATPGVVHWLVQLSPATAINGVLLHLGPWTQEPTAYHLTDLGQNVAYALPVTAITCIAAHLVVGVALIVVAWKKLEPKKPAELRSAANQEGGASADL